jgi:endonuclease IV
MNSFDEGSSLTKSVSQEKNIVPEAARLIAIGILFLCVVYLFYSGSQYKKQVRSELDRIAEQVQILENSGKLTEASLSGQISGLKDEIEKTREALSVQKNK